MIHESIKKHMALSVDVCVIGAGAAGITIAKKLVAAGKTVALMEMGGTEKHIPLQEELNAPLHLHKPGSQTAKIGSIPNYFRDSRSFRLGGSTICWANYCRKLDPIVVGRRPWLNLPGWPIPYSELDKYYPEAYALCRVPPVDDQKMSGDYYPPFNQGRLVSQVYHSRPDTTLFWETYRDDLAAAEVFPMTRFVGFRMINDVEASDAHFIAGRYRVDVRAKQYVMAMGGAENTRSLLQQTKIGYRANMGHWFMEHLQFDAGRIVIPELKAGDLMFYNFMQGFPVTAYVKLSEDAQRSLKVLNGQIDFDPLPFDAGFEMMGAKEGQWCGRLRYISEMMPDFNSRLSLSKATDALGMPKIAGALVLNDELYRSISRFLDALSEDLPGAKITRYFNERTVPDFNWAKDLYKRIYMYPSHHIGTLRMASEPDLGVVDENCRLFGVDNIHVAGSAVFPTGGRAAPTLTIVALALRLAEHLKTKV